MTALYNEIDPKAAAWLRALISAGHIAPGIVDERSIEDLTPDYLRQFTQVHFFAGIGVWSYALRAAGWPDDRPVWTGSCPCQPFSAAGKGGGFDDERHLWPAFHWLISQCRPPVVFGEQVASKDGLGWLDLVQADLEGTGYASGAVDLCAAGVGAPHIRQRLWWYGERLADTDPRGKGVVGNGGHSLDLGQARDARAGHWGGHQAESGWNHAGRPIAEAGGFERVAHRDGGAGGQGRPVGGGGTHRGDAIEGAGPSGGSELERLADTERREPELNPGAWAGPSGATGEGAPGGLERRGDDPAFREPERHLSDGTGASVDDRLCDVAVWPGPVNGLWADADWLHCRDGKWRPVEPGTFPLAHGTAERVGRLRGYGNAIVAPAAQAFIQAYLDAAVI